MKSIFYSFAVATAFIFVQSQTFANRPDNSVKQDKGSLKEKDLDAYYDSIYRADHPLLEKVYNEDPSSIGKHPANRQTTFSYSNSYVPNSATVNTQKAVGQIEIIPEMSPSGAKTYTIPIKSYKASGVFSPEISLSYNSQGRGSYAGKGWTIGGLQSITRGNTTLYYDGKTKGISMTPDDAFYLNGVRLIRTSNNSYEYETEQGHIKVVAVVSGNITRMFNVYYPNGYRAAFYLPTNNYNLLEYPITQLTDNLGRSIYYSYTYSASHFHIRTIEYENNKAKIQFTYDDNRADYVGGYSGGMSLDCRLLLKNITFSRNNTELGTYTLSHIINNNTSLLSQIDYSTNGSSLNPLKFYYGNGSAVASYEDISCTYLAGYNYQHRRQLRVTRGRFDYSSGDDGLFVFPNETPYLYINEGSTKKFNNQYPSDQTIYAYCNLSEDYAGILPELNTEEGFIDLFCADLEGQRIESLIKVNNKVNGNLDQITFKVYKHNVIAGIALHSTHNFSFSTVYTDGNQNKSIQPKFYFPGDFNGDGKMEILAVSAENPFGESYRPSKCYIFDLQNGTKLYEGHVFSFHKEFPSSGDFNTPEDNSDKIIPLDYDGDGKMDICHVTASGTTIYSFESNNGIWSVNSGISNSLITKSSLYSGRFYSCGDFNGDGLTDIITSDIRGYGTNWTIYDSEGDGSFNFHYFQGPNMQTSAESDFIIQDVDRDGTSDLIELTSSQMRTYIMKNRQASLSSTTSLNNENELVVPVNTNSSTLTYQLVSIKGYIAKLYAYMTNLMTDQALTGMINSLGVIDKNYYYSIAKDNYGIYVKSSSATFPYSNLFEGIPVIAGNEIFLNGSSKDINKYYYENAVLHGQGMGFRGFENIRIKNKRGQFTTSTYEPYNFSLLKEIDAPTFRHTNTNSVTIASNKIVQAVVSSATQYDKLKGITSNTSCTYDSYGQLLTESTTLPGNISVNKSFTYTNYTNINSKYHLGVLTTSAVATSRGNSQHTESKNYSSYNSFDQPQTIVEKVNGYTLKTTTLAYDNKGNITSRSIKPYSSTVPRTSVYTYNSDNRLTNATTPVGTSQSFTYNTDGTISQMTDYTGNTTYNYDAFGRKINETSPDNSELNTSFAWDSSNGGLYSITMSGTGIPTVKTVYDALNREVKNITTRFDGTKTMVVKSYDAYGNMNQESLPYKNSAPVFNQYTYDYYDRLTQKVEAGKTTTYTYSGLSTTANDGTTYTITTTDALGGVVSVADPAGTITYTLNGAGNPIAITTPSDNGTISTSITYDSYERKTATNDPSYGTIAYSYDGSGRLQSETNANNATISYAYDNYDRLTTKTVPEFTTSYSYDNNLNALTAVTSTNGTSTTYSYDAYGRLSSVRENAVDSKWLKKDYSYANGRVSATQYTSQSGLLATENYTYANGWLKEVKLNNSTSIFKLTSENGMGHTSQITTGNLTRNYSFSSYGLPTSRTILLGNSANDVTTYNFNSVTGNLTSRAFPLKNKTENFTYDNLYRLTNYDGTAVTYDDNGNILSKGDIGSFAYNISCKPFAVSEVTLSNSISAGAQSVSYNSFERPATITDNGYTVSFTYNSEFDRVRMTKVRNSQTQLTRYYLGGCYELDIKPSGTTEKLYLNGGYYDAPAVLIKQGSSSNVYNIVRDHLGSVTRIYNASGTLMQELSYDAWGRMRDPSTFTLYAPTSEPEPYLGRGYCGHEHLTGLGLINMNARLYDPVLGRFLAADPFVQAPNMTQNFNRYSYCLNNPLRFSDTSGEVIGIDDVICIVVASAVIGGTINAISNSHNIHNFWDAFGYFSVGAAAGAVGAYAGGAIAIGGVIGGALSGLVSGVSAGGILGAGNSFMANGNFNQIWSDALNGMIAGGVSGAVVGGIAGGVSSYLKGENIWTGKANPTSIEPRRPQNPQPDAMPTKANADMSAQSAGEIQMSTFIDDTIPLPSSVAKETMNSAAFPTGEGSNIVYYGIDDLPKIRYIGITKRTPVNRFLEHLYSGTERAALRYFPIEGAQSLSRIQARIIEQQLINTYGLGSNGGLLFNKINSISPRYWNNWGITIKIRF